MNEPVEPVNSMSELPPETRGFLASLRHEDVETLKDGVRLVNAIRTVGTFFKWLLVGILGFVVGTVMLYESVVEMFAWFRH